MKRKITELHHEESKLSKLLFNKTKDFVEKIKCDNEINNAEDEQTEQKPIWFDEDDEQFAEYHPNAIKGGVYSEKLKQKYEALVGTPNWAKLNRQTKSEYEDDDILRTVGHLQKKKSTQLPKGLLEIKRFPKVNSETANEGPVISCVEFHPKLSVALVAGHSGVVSIFSIGGETNNKLHSFKLKKWNITSAQFTPDGTEALIASKLNHSYCVYNLVKAEPKLLQLPRFIKRPNIFVLSPDGKYIAASDALDEVYILSASSKELLRSLKHNTNVSSVTFSSNSEQLYCYCVQGEITIWELSTFRAIKKFYDHGCVTASCITTSPCGKLLATGSNEGIVNIYDIPKIMDDVSVPIKTISNLTTKITNLKVNATSEILAATSSFYPNAVKLIHIPSYHVFSNFPPPSDNLHQVDTVNFSPNSGYMALGNNKGHAYLYRLKHYKNY